MQQKASEVLPLVMLLTMLPPIVRENRQANPLQDSQDYSSTIILDSIIHDFFWSGSSLT
jgi:hypothetical protein